MSDLITAGKHTVVPDDLVTHVALEIGAFTSIASGLRIVSGQHPGIGSPKLISDFPFFEHRWSEDWPPSDMGFGVVIGNDVWIGEDVHILDRVYIGDGARVGAGAVVAKDVRPYSTVVGNPATMTGLRFQPEQVEMLRRIAWWDWPDEKIRECLPEMQKVHMFVMKHRVRGEGF